MPTVAELPNGDFIYVYEYGGEPSRDSYWFPVYYRLSTDPLAFNDAAHHRLTPSNANGSTPAGSPFVVWSPWGGENGTIVVSSGGASQIFTNQKLGAEDAWLQWDVPQPTAYTRSLLVFREDPDLLAIIGGGVLPPSTTNEVSLSVVRLSEVTKPEAKRYARL